MAQAFELLLSGDAETWGIIGRSLSFSFFATVFSLIPGIPLGVFMAWKASKGRRFLASLIHAISALAHRRHWPLCLCLPIPLRPAWASSASFTPPQASSSGNSSSRCPSSPR